MVRSFALNINVPGECYLIRLKTPTKQGNRPWSGRSSPPTSSRSASTAPCSSPIRGDAKKKRAAEEHLHRPDLAAHPRYSGEPDSSLMGVADSIEELLILQRLVRSATRSRLNNGLLFLPDGLLTTRMSMALQGLDEDGNPLTEEELAAMANDPGNQLVADILQAIVTAVSDEGDASAVAPLMVTGEGGLGDQIKHITFERGSDAWLVDRTERALERILQGIDVPKEVVTGLANVKYSNALVIDENLYKANIEPLALVLVDALTEVFLRPCCGPRAGRRTTSTGSSSGTTPARSSPGPTRRRTPATATTGWCWARAPGAGSTASATRTPRRGRAGDDADDQRGRAAARRPDVAAPGAAAEDPGQQRQQNVSAQPVPFPQSASTGARAHCRGHGQRQ
jgi:hypothetical protein